MIKYLLFLLVCILLFLLVILLIKIFKKYKYKYKHEEQFEDTTQIKKNDLAIYVINLPKNKDRLDHLIQLHNNSDIKEIPFTRIEAVNGKEIDVEPYVTSRVFSGIMDIDNNNGERYHHSQITRGAVGCYLSHLKIYKEMKESSKPYALILEDDAWFNKDIYENGIASLHTKVPKDWDIILLGRTDLDIVPQEKYIEMREFCGTHGYIINKNGILKFLEHGNTPINDQIDAVMGKLAREKILHIYALHEQYIVPNNTFGSEIQMPITVVDGKNPDLDPFL
jgi:glycosyl transferase family 25